MNILAHSRTTRQSIGRALGVLFLGLCLLAILISIAAPMASRAAADEPMLLPDADTYVKSSDPDANFGDAGRFGVDGKPQITSFLRFAVSGVGQNVVSRSRLRLYVLDAAPTVGLKAFRTDANWNEMAVTYKTQPQAGPQVASLAPGVMQAGAWFEIDLGQTIAGDGIYSFALTTDSSDQAIFTTRSRSEAPQLVLTLNTSVAQPSPTVTTVATVAPTAMATAIPAQLASGPLTAFPGAEGFGAQTPGGRGGRVIYVTTLADSGAGSLRAALEATGPRIVLFKVAGTITLQDDIKIKQPYLTVAGQSAPGQGVQIKSGMIQIKTHDVVLRYLKMRVGDALDNSPTADRDAIALSGTSGADVYNIVIDHCSLLWGPDIGGVSMLVNVHDVTLQNSILGEGPYLSNHPEATVAQSGHSMSASIFPLDTSSAGGYPKRITMHHNLFTTSDHRNPVVIGAENVDLVNNVMYNWGQKAAHGNPRKLNLINNMFIKGPMTKGLLAWMPQLHSTTPSYFSGAVFEQGNVPVGFTKLRGDPQSVYAGARFSPYSIVNEQTAQQAYDRIVQDAGANRPSRDSVDQRLITNLVQRTGKFMNGSDLLWPTLASGPVPADSDADGMPDTWEQTQFGSLNRSANNSSSSDFDSDGYTDLEEYLNNTNPKVAGQ